MKKWLTYFLLSIYLLSFTEAKQVLKLPNLVEHYISHEIRNKNISLFKFIKIHYLDEQVMDSDYKQDMSLPFKTHDFSTISINLVIPPKKIEFSFEPKKLFVEKNQNFTYSETFYPSVFQKIWQPPKI